MLPCSSLVSQSLQSSQTLHSATVVSRQRAHFPWASFVSIGLIKDHIRELSQRALEGARIVHGASQDQGPLNTGDGVLGALLRPLRGKAGLAGDRGQRFRPGCHSLFDMPFQLALVWAKG